MSRQYKTYPVHTAEDWAEANEPGVAHWNTSHRGWSLGDITESGTEVEAPSRLRRHTPQTVQKAKAVPVKTKVQPPNTRSNLCTALRQRAAENARYPAPRLDFQLEHDGIYVRAFRGTFYLEGKEHDFLRISPDPNMPLLQDIGETWANLINMVRFKH